MYGDNQITKRISQSELKCIEHKTCMHVTPKFMTFATEYIVRKVKMVSIIANRAFARIYVYEHIYIYMSQHAPKKKTKFLKVRWISSIFPLVGHM